MPKHPKREAEKQFMHGSAPGRLHGGSHLDAQARSRVKRRKKKNKKRGTYHWSRRVEENNYANLRLGGKRGIGGDWTTSRVARLSPESLHAM